MTRSNILEHNANNTGLYAFHLFRFFLNIDFSLWSVKEKKANRKQRKRFELK